MKYYRKQGYLGQTFVCIIVGTLGFGIINIFIGIENVPVLLTGISICSIIFYYFFNKILVKEVRIIELLPEKVVVTYFKNTKLPPAVINIQDISVVEFDTIRCYPDHWYVIHSKFHEVTGFSSYDVPIEDMLAYCKEKKLPVKEIIRRNGEVADIKMKRKSITIYYCHEKNEKKPPVILRAPETKSVQYVSVPKEDSYAHDYIIIEMSNGMHSEFNHYMTEIPKLKSYCSKNNIPFIETTTDGPVNKINYQNYY
ncbi:MAG: hypothetical protein K0Q79_69 [Flavipsychrobacter sp.]|jgi:hypothetical protein|nr:hypothetical protein [Flavipsychrobacter sp.]